MNQTRSQEHPSATDGLSLVVTVLDEAKSIDRLLASIAAQTRPPEEVVVVDGGSTDGTWDRLQAWATRLPLRAIRLPGLNIAAGRNAAISAAQCAWIAVTDAGVELQPDWLEHLERVSYSSEADVVAGFFEPDSQTPFQTAMGATVLPALEDVDPEMFLPSSRSILFRRQAWQEVGGYPEWLDYCEDLVFDLALKRAGHRFAFAHLAVARFRTRESLRQFFRQYYLYARGDGKADLWRGRHAIRYATYLSLALALASGRWRQPLALGLLLLGAAAYTRRPYQRLWARREGLTVAMLLYACLHVPLIRLVGDVAKMSGYPVGLWWRIGQSSATPLAEQTTPPRDPVEVAKTGSLD